TGNTAKQEAKVFARNLCIKVSALNYLRMKRSCTEPSIPETGGTNLLHLSFLRLILPVDC
ncbi:MAG: hypothetical protein K2O82_00255, partial [Alistipes sp.]|nr:hypothetical protein [Alistipes sp.]